MKVTTTDDTLRIYRERDLSSSVIAQVAKGVEVQLDTATVYEGREWMEATLEDGSVGYVLGPSARGHTTLGEVSSGAEKRNSPQPVEVEVTVGRRVLAGLSLGIAAVIATVLIFLALPLILYGFRFLLAQPGNKSLAPARGEEAQAISQFWAQLHGTDVVGFEIRAIRATMLFWGFLGAYVTGFSIGGGQPLTVSKTPWRVTALLASSLLICALGRWALQVFGLYRSDTGVAVLSFFLGLVGGAALYFKLFVRTPRGV